MSSPADTETDRTPGSVPNAWRNALFWRWAPALPRELADGFLKALQALGQGADASGRLRFRDGKPIKITAIAAAARVDEKDCRRYLDAAITAGVVAVEGERRRGRPALYVLVLSPFPNWGAAADYLKTTQRKRTGRKAAPWQTEDGEKFGGPPPELPDAEFGGPPPVLQAAEPGEVRGTAPGMSSGDRPPFGSGDRPPNNPCRPMNFSQGRADSGPQPQESAGTVEAEFESQGQERHAPAAPPGATVRCPRCTGPMITRPGRDICGGCDRADRRATREAS